MQEAGPGTGAPLRLDTGAARQTAKAGMGARQLRRRGMSTVLHYAAERGVEEDADAGFGHFILHFVCQRFHL